VTEGAMNDWSAIYMKDVAKASAELAPMGIAVVSVMMVLARLFADGWRSRWGDGRIVRTGGRELAAELEQKGYEFVREELYKEPAGAGTS